MTPAPDGVPARSGIDRAFLTGDPDAGELILVRHGQQDFPPAGTKDIDAWLDPPLSKTGIRQAEAIGRCLAARPVAAVYSSRLKRAASTGLAIAEHHGLDVATDDRFREIEMFRGLPSDNRNPTEFYGADRMRQAQEDFVATRRWASYPGAETGDELRARVAGAVEGILAAHPREVVVVACHGGVINAYVGWVLGATEDMFFRPAHASAHRIAFAGERRVVSALNDIAHLEPAEELLTC